MNHDDDSDLDVNKDENHDPENQEMGENQEVENVNEEVSKYEVSISDSESSPEPDDECNNKTIHESNGSDGLANDSMNELDYKEGSRIQYEVSNNLGPY